MISNVSSKHISNENKFDLDFKEGLLHQIQKTASKDRLHNYAHIHLYITATAHRNTL